MIKFGVGCFHFSINNRAREGLIVLDYINEIKQNLETINNIKNIDVHLFDEAVKTDPIDVSEPNLKLRNGESCYPHLHFLEITFSIYIPARIQATLLDEPEESLKSYNENFVVEMKYNWYGPVTYITCLDKKQHVINQAQ